MNFKPGDVCEIVHPKTRPELKGFECEVVDAAHQHSHLPMFGHNIQVRGVLAPDHPRGWFFAEPYQLRLKRPPSWDSWIYDTREVRTSNDQPVSA